MNDWKIYSKLYFFCSQLTSNWVALFVIPKTKKSRQASTEYTEYTVLAGMDGMLHHKMIFDLIVKHNPEIILLL